MTYHVYVENRVEDGNFKSLHELLKDNVSANQVAFNLVNNGRSAQGSNRSLYTTDDIIMHIHTTGYKYENVTYSYSYTYDGEIQTYEYETQERIDIGNINSICAKYNMPDKYVNMSTYDFYENWYNSCYDYDLEPSQTPTSYAYGYTYDMDPCQIQNPYSLVDLLEYKPVATVETSTPLIYSNQNSIDYTFSRGDYCRNKYVPNYPSCVITDSKHYAHTDYYQYAYSYTLPYDEYSSKVMDQNTSLNDIVNHFNNKTVTRKFNTDINIQIPTLQVDDLRNINPGEIPDGYIFEHSDKIINKSIPDSWQM